MKTKVAENRVVGVLTFEQIKPISYPNNIHGPHQKLQRIDYIFFFYLLFVVLVILYSIYSSNSQYKPH